MGNSSLVWLFMLAVVGLGVGGYLFNDENPFAGQLRTATTTETGTLVNETENGGDVRQSVSANTVRYTDTGFSPATLTVKKGTTVTFVRQAELEMWVGSGEHPTHTHYDGTSREDHCPNNGTAFDQCGRSNTYSFTFNKVGTWDYHNHVEDEHGGTIIVTE